MSDAATRARGRPSVRRVHAISDTGYPYEIHHVAAPTPTLTACDADPVEAAERALAALRDRFPAWLATDMDRVAIALTDYRETRGEDPVGHLWRRLHDMRGNAAMLGREDLSRVAARAAGLLEAPRVDRAAVIAAVGTLLSRR